ncbi:MAG: MBL fold metallo-hydrolase [Bacteroidales bacterium]|nr:MBL fold metallo-hydrolase [Bacteroidota bacterium]MBL6950897.1 MBL fold metallo-hydrolase [Bacteroidales bacterium]
MITIKTFVFNAFMVNTYLLYDETREAIIVDAGCADEYEENKLADFIESNGLKLVRNITTHCHVDHILGNAFIESQYNIRPEYHKASGPFLFTAKEVAATFGQEITGIPEAERFLEDEEMIKWGASELKVLLAPGHADGSVCLYNKEQGFVLTGDVMFAESIGRTDLPSGNYNLLIESIQEKLLTLPDNTIVYPGHGPETSIGHERKYNPFIR